MTPQANDQELQHTSRKTMIEVKADLHIHTVLSPCGDFDMSPRIIVEQALAKNLGIIGITDHNSLKQVGVVEKLAAERGIFVLGGVEITTREEVHCLAFFPDAASRQLFQHYIDEHQPVIPNIDGAFGYQAVVSEDDMILELVEKLLITALDQSIEKVAMEVHRLGGIFIPAHIDRSVNSVFSQLGFIPGDLHFDALEITCFTTQNDARRRFYLSETIPLIHDSDAHYPADIGKGYTRFTLNSCSFEEIRLALAGADGRRVDIM